MLNLQIRSVVALLGVHVHNYADIYATAASKPPGTLFWIDSPDPRFVAAARKTGVVRPRRFELLT